MTPLVQKFKIERNTPPYPAHEGEYFVLFPGKDLAAWQALVTYAEAVEDSNPVLASQLDAWLEILAEKESV